MATRVILVTGANGGLGHAIARSFFHEAAANFVWLGVHTHREKAAALAQEFSERGRVVDLEVTRADSWQSAVSQILAEHNRLDVLINNAGCHQDGLLANMPTEAWQRVLATNLDAVFYGCQAVLRTMIAQRSGRIVNIASLSAVLAPAGQTNYAAAKAGVIGMTQSLAKEVARIGITVNAVCPGYVETDALAGMSEADRKAALSRIPMRRFGRPDELAAAVRFLACAEATYITGSVLKVDGGIL